MKKIVALCLVLANIIGLAGAAKAQDNPSQYGIFRLAVAGRLEGMGRAVRVVQPRLPYGPVRR